MSRLATGQPVVFVHTAYFLPRRILQLLRAPGGERRARLAELVGGLRERPGTPLLFSAWNLVPLGQRMAWASRVNGRVTAARLRRALRRRGLAAAVAWAYDPLVTPIVRGLRAPLAVYHCVDDHAGQAGNSAARTTLERGERELVGAVDIVFTTADSLARRLAALHPRVHRLGNVADFDHFSAAADGRAAIPVDLAAVPAPRALFVGALSELKVDLALLEALASARPDLSVVVVGPVTFAGAAYRARLRALGGLPNVHLLGGRGYAELPGYLAGADTCLIPYLQNRYTAGVFPMKVYEYLAAGRAVVAAGLPELAGTKGVALARDPDGFVAAVADALMRPAVLASRQEPARRHTWEARTAEMDRLAREAAPTP